MCLFDVLMRLKDRMNLTIHPVHVNHKFRPGAAEHDQQYVENLCMQRGLECTSFEIVTLNEQVSEAFEASSVKLRQLAITVTFVVPPFNGLNMRSSTVPTVSSATLYSNTASS